MHAYLAAIVLALSSSDGQVLLHQIREVYRAHAASPYVTYTLRREQFTPDGAPDFEWSYTYRVWYRASDASALERRSFRGRLGQLEFTRVVFNEACDPGPATADLFNLPPVTPQPAPAPTRLPVIASVVATPAPLYDVTYAQREGGSWHLRLRPRRDPDSNRLRELWADASTLELQKAVVTDRLFIQGGPVYDQLDTLTLALFENRIVITHIHTRADFTDDGRAGDGLDVDYTFSDVGFPAAMPDWYFRPASYGAHVQDAPG